MRSALIAIVIGACALFATPASAVPPDPAFTQQMYREIEDRKNEALARIVATGFHPTDQQFQNAWCQSLMWWKMSHPGGEARLTMQGLIHLRRLEVMCAQRMRRAPVLPAEPQTPPVTHVAIPTDGTLDTDGTHEAVQDYLRWHPEEFEDAPTLHRYILARLLWWHMFGTGDPGTDGYQEAEAAERAKAEEEWRARHPDATDARFDPHGAAPVEGPWHGDPRVWSGRGGPGSYPLDPEDIPSWMRQSILEWENRTADGSVDPLDQTGANLARESFGFLGDSELAGVANSATQDLENWRRVRNPIIVGTNDEVGSGARRRQQITGAAVGAIGNVLGVRGGSREPELARCRTSDSTSTHFENGDVAIDVVAQRRGDTVTLFTEVARSPDAGTFQTALLLNQGYQALAPSDVDICDLYGQWRLSVSWTSTTYQDGRHVARDAGGWSESGSPGMHARSGSAPGKIDTRYASAQHFRCGDSCERYHRQSFSA